MRDCDPTPSGMIGGVATEKVSLTLDERLVAEARSRAGRVLSAYVNEALRGELQRDRLTGLLARMDAERGPVPAEQLEEAREPWQGKGRRRRRG